MNYAERIRRRLPTVTSEESYRVCEDRLRATLDDYRWLVSSLSRETRRHVAAVTALTLRAAQLCDLRVGRAARMEMLDDLREDLRNNLMEEESTDQFPALLNTIRTAGIPLQFPHDIVSAPDYCLRVTQFGSFDDWLQFGYRLGGGTLLSLAPIFDASGDGHVPAAISLGQAICLTWLLGEMGRDVQTMTFYLPIEEMRELSIDFERHQASQPVPELVRLVSSLAGRIEELFAAGESFVDCVGPEGQRCLGSLLTRIRQQLAAIQEDPAHIFSSDHRGNHSRGKLRYP